jgi:hypothetical protein
MTGKMRSDPGTHERKEQPVLRSGSVLFERLSKLPKRMAFPTLRFGKLLHDTQNPLETFLYTSVRWDSVDLLSFLEFFFLTHSYIVAIK